MKNIELQLFRLNMLLCIPPRFRINEVFQLQISKRKVCYESYKEFVETLNTYIYYNFVTKLRKCRTTDKNLINIFTRKCCLLFFLFCNFHFLRTNFYKCKIFCTFFFCSFFNQSNIRSFQSCLSRTYAKILDKTF